MAVVKELIRTEENGGISFGNYELPTKSKASDFPYQCWTLKCRAICIK